MDVSIACPCPPLPNGEARHASDTVSLHEPIDPRTRRALLYDLSLMGADVTPGDQLAALNEGYVLRCIDRWSLVDETGKPLPPSREHIRRILIEQPTFGDPVARAADDLYSEAVLLPLLLGASSSSLPTPIAEPTQATTDGSTLPTRRSRRSSTSTTPMVVTGPMLSSPGGVSS